MLKWIKRLRKTQPPTKKKVIELIVGGRIGAFMSKHNWGAVTYPFPFLVVILYWSNKTPVYDFDVPGATRVHEFTHVAQDEGNAFFLVTWAKYVWECYRKFPFVAWWYNFETFGQAWMDAYWHNKYEVEAYAVEAKAESDGLPPWAK